jgi:hypothetical protein
VLTAFAPSSITAQRFMTYARSFAGHLLLLLRKEDNRS